MVPTDQELKKKVKPKKRTNTAPEIQLDSDLLEFFNPANAKDKDFDLDLDAARFQGRKGQAGTRTKSGGGDSPYELILSRGEPSQDSVHP